MTTMDSDSESQDSDEGRRFRFEATRKDSTASSHSRKRRSPQSLPNSRRRSRSRDRHRDRKDADRPRRDYKKELQSNADPTNSTKDHDTKYSREPNDAARSAHRHRDSKDSKNLSNHKEWKDSRDDRKSRREPPGRSRDRDKRRSHERSTDRNHDEKSISDNKYPSKSRERIKRQSAERIRERSRPGSSAKSHPGRSREDSNKTEAAENRKPARKEENEEIASVRMVEKAGKSRLPSNSGVTTQASSHDCKDLNLSDFDIVSDTEENSSDTSGSRRRSKEPISGSMRNVPSEPGSCLKKRISKQQYERLFEKQSVKNRCNLDKLHKVKERNGERSPSGSNNNSSVDPNFLLGIVTSPTVGKKSGNDVEKSPESRTETLASHDKACIESMETDVSNSCSKNSALPREIADSRKEEIDGVDAAEEDISALEVNKEIPACRIIGPTLPAHLRQVLEDNEMEVEDTFGPALPPHLTLHNEPDEEPEVTDGAVSPVERSPPASEEEDDDFLGPLPADHPALENDIVQQRLENRARRLKAELAACDAEDEKKREEWMIELPPAQSVNLGLGPRKFRVRPASDMSDRSSWTDTPADRARKQMEMLEGKKIEGEPVTTEDRDASRAATESSKSKKRPKSLLEIHQKKMQKKKKKDDKEAKKSGKPIERRPFDRNVDLQANQFDEARKKRMVLKARELDDRFSRGKI